MKQKLKSILFLICFLTPNILSISNPETVVEYSLGQLSPTGGRNKGQYDDLIVDYETPAQYKDQNGNLNSAYDIQNSKQYLTLKNFKFSSQVFSLSLWIKFSSYSVNGAIYHLVLENYEITKTEIYLNKDDVMGNLDEWILVGGTFKNQDENAYFYNGLSMDRQFIHYRINLSELTKLSLYIGNDDFKKFPFIGQVSDLHIYDTELGINEFRLIKDPSYQVFIPEWQTIFQLKNNLLDMENTKQLSFEQDYTQKQSKGYKSIDRYGDINSSIKLNSIDDSLYIPISLFKTDSNQVSVSILFKTNYADNLNFLQIADKNNNIIFLIKNYAIDINHQYIKLPKPLYSDLKQNQFHLLTVVFDLNANQVTIYISGEQLGVYSIPYNSNKQFMKEISYVQVVEISPAQENQSIIIDDIYIYDKVLDPIHVTDLQEWKIGYVTPKIFSHQFFRLNQDLQSDVELDKQLTYPANYVQQQNEFEDVQGFNSYNDFKVKNFFGKNPLKTDIYLFNLDKLTMWVKFDGDNNTTDSIVAKITNEGLGKTYKFEITIKIDSMHVLDQELQIDKTIPFNQSLNKEKESFNLITIQYTDTRSFKVKVGHTVAGSIQGKLSYLEFYNYKIGLVLGQNFYGQMFNIRLIKLFDNDVDFISELTQLGREQNDNFLTESQQGNPGNDQPNNGDETPTNGGQPGGNNNPQIPSECEEQLRHLNSRNVNIDFEIVDNNGRMEHFYTIYFGEFILKDSCYSLKMELANSPIAYTLSLDKKQMYIQFYNDNAVSNGCIQVKPHELECGFNLQLSYNNTSQMTKKFISIVQANDLNNIQNGLQLQIIGDHSDTIKNINAAINTEVNLCKDSSCSEYKDELVMQRNDVSYVEMRVTTPQYKSFYPVHRSLKLGGKEFLPENLSEIQNWDQQGRIIYQVKPHIASDNLLLQIQIGLVENLSRRRVLSDQQQEQIKLSNDDMVGKQIFIVIKESDDQKSYQEDQNQTALILGITLGSIAFISLSGGAVILTILKIKKLKMLSQVAQTQTLPIQTTQGDLKNTQTNCISHDNTKDLSDIVTTQ